jgi:cytochrome c
MEDKSEITQKSQNSEEKLDKDDIYDVMQYYDTLKKLRNQKLKDATTPKKKKDLEVIDQNNESIEQVTLIDKANERHISPKASRKKDSHKWVISTNTNIRVI